MFDSTCSCGRCSKERKTGNNLRTVAASGAPPLGGKAVLTTDLRYSTAPFSLPFLPLVSTKASRASRVARRAASNSPSRSPTCFSSRPADDRNSATLASSSFLSRTALRNKPRSSAASRSFASRSRAILSLSCASSAFVRAILSAWAARLSEAATRSRSSEHSRWSSRCCRSRASTLALCALADAAAARLAASKLSLAALNSSVALVLFEEDALRVSISLRAASSSLRSCSALRFSRRSDATSACRLSTSRKATASSSAAHASRSFCAALAAC
mmetsp:Transcript_7666/g.22649  ORF Transcript_7666/g.22649 Transcript_7666/m.22649 type:complete len:273 (+) Transcript_7666:609-1427(+)